MSLPSIASEPNVVVASRRPGTSAHRADDAPAQPADSFASALDDSDNNNNGGEAPAPASEPATQPGATAPSGQASPAAKGLPAPASSNDATVAATNAAAVGGATVALDAIAFAAGIHVSTDGKVAPAGKASSATAAAGTAPGDTTTASTAPPQTDPSTQMPILAVLLPAPPVSPAPAPTTAPAGQAQPAAGIAMANIATTGVAATGIATTGVAATGVAAAGVAPADIAVAGTAAANAATVAAAAALPTADASATGKVQGTPESAPAPAQVAAASVSLSAGLDPKAIQLLATARTGGDAKPTARVAANAARAPETPHTPAATSGTAGPSAGSPAAVAPVQGNSSDPHGGDTGARKGPRDEADAATTGPASAEPNALRSGATATATLATTSAVLTTHATDTSQSASGAAQVVAAITSASGSSAQIVAAPAAAAAAQVAASYGAAVPLSGVAAEITAQVRDGKNRFEIRLDPPDLGRIDVTLNVDKQGQVTSHLVVDRSETLDLLRRDAPSLERALQSAGLKTDSGGLEFSLRDQSQQRSAPTTPSTPVTSPLPDDELAPVAAAQRSYWRLGGVGSGVDISV